MPVVVPHRRLLGCIVTCALLIIHLPAWADGEADQIARAKQLVTEKKYDDAIAILSPIASASTEPFRKQAKESLAFCYKAAKQWDRALALLQSLPSDYPSDVQVWQLRLGTCYRQMGRRSEALLAYRTGLDATPRRRDVTRDLATQLVYCYAPTKDWAKAASVYQSLLEKCPEDAAEWQRQLALCYRRMGRKAEATAGMEKAMELAKGDAKAVKRIEPDLASAYWGNRDYPELIALYQSLANQYPADAAHWTLELARSYQAAGKRSEAISACRKGIDLAGADREARVALKRRLGLCYIASKDWPSAITHYQALVTEYPDQAGRWHYYIGLCHQRTGRASEAMAEFEAGLRAAGTDAYTKWLIQCRLNPVYMSQGSASPDTETGAATGPSDSSPDTEALRLLQRAYDLQAGGDCAQAIPAFQDIIDRFPKNQREAESALICIVECTCGLGKTDEAIARAKSVYDAQPKMRAAALFAQGVANSFAGRHAAVESLRRLIAECPGSYLAKEKGKHYLIASLQAIGQVDEAVAAARTLCSKNDSPDRRAQVTNIVVSLYAKAGRLAEACTELKALLDAGNLPPNREAGALVNLVSYYKKLGDETTASKYMAELGRKFPNGLPQSATGGAQ